MLGLNKVYNMDCIEGMRLIDDNSIDSIVTDPPYELGFMGKSWDNTGISNNKEMWAECLRILKPGGYLLSFGGTRTYHRMASAIEDAGFEVRDMIEWVYGSGFPKSLNIGKAVDKRGGTTADQSKEFAEYIKNKRNELNITLSKADEVICGGTTNYSWFEGRPAGQRLPRKSDYLKMKELLNLDDRYDSFMEETEREVVGLQKKAMSGWNIDGTTQFKDRDITKGTSEWEGWGTALKPAHEPICMARKPLSEPTVASNCLKWGTGGINIDESRVGTTDTYTAKGMSSLGVMHDDSWQPKEIKQEMNSAGRFPANLIHDNSKEVRGCFPNESERFFKSIIYQAKASKSERNKGCEGLEEKQKAGAEFRPNHQEKANNGETGNPFGRWNKIVNNHPTVKPIALMEYLIKMVTPKCGVVLDPFMGSGTTGCASKKNGYNYIGFELDKGYREIANKRIQSIQSQLF